MSTSSVKTINCESTLLGIPPEIRRIIYAYALKPKIVHAGSRHPHACREDPDPDLSDLFDDRIEVSRDVSTTRLEDFSKSLTRKNGYCDTCGSGSCSSDRCWETVPSSRALLYTCRTIYREAVEVSYERTRFDFSLTDSFYGFSRALRSHGHARLVTRLELCFYISRHDGDLEWHLLPYLRDGGMRRIFPGLTNFNAWFARIHYPMFADELTDYSFTIVIEIIRQLSSLLKDYDKLQVRVKGLLSREVEELLALSIMENRWLLPDDIDDMVRDALVEYNSHCVSGDNGAGADDWYDRKARLADPEEMGLVVDEEGREIGPPGRFRWGRLT